MFDAYEDVVKIEDVREMLNIGKNKAYSLLTKGELHGFKIGRIWKVSKKSVIEYIEHNTKHYQ